MRINVVQPPSSGCTRSMELGKHSIGSTLDPADPSLRSRGSGYTFDDQRFSGRQTPTLQHGCTAGARAPATSHSRAVFISTFMALSSVPPAPLQRTSTNADTTHCYVFCQSNFLVLERTCVSGLWHRALAGYTAGHASCGPTNTSSNPREANAGILHPRDAQPPPCDDTATTRSGRY